MYKTQNNIGLKIGVPICSKSQKLQRNLKLLRNLLTLLVLLVTKLIFSPYFESNLKGASLGIVYKNRTIVCSYLHYLKGQAVKRGEKVIFQTENVKSQPQRWFNSIFE